MPGSDLKIRITNTAGNALRAQVDIDLAPVSGPPGAGGEGMTVSVNMGSATDLTITGIACQGGPGSRYKVQLRTPHYRPYGFFQLIQEGPSNQAGDDVEFWVKPGDVSSIRAAAFAALPAKLQQILTDAQMTVDKPEDKDLANLAGAALYNKLGPLRKAALLNIATKATHVSSAECMPLIGALLVCRQDRFFAFVDAAMPSALAGSPRWKSAPNVLHEPLPGFEMTGESFKTRDAHANLQATFQRRISDGLPAADIDIDESSGIEHGFEVIRNAAFNKRTNPYLIHEFMLTADPIERSLDPGYSFVF